MLTHRSFETQSGVTATDFPSFNCTYTHAHSHLRNRTYILCSHTGRLRHSLASQPPTFLPLIARIHTRIHTCRSYIHVMLTHRSFETQSGVTAIDFSSSNPNILALGLYSGAVAVYDVRQKQGTPSMESDAATGKHSDPVWKVRF